jgi:poly-gamma-glutamate synthesis protein (capsule biosynthesis protein)
MRTLALLLAFHASVAPAPKHMTSWHTGCPVPVSQLRLVTLTHWGFDGRVHEGRLVVNADATAAIVRVFRTLYRVRYPIRRLELVDRYGADEHRSMAADNTSAFNCRNVSGTSHWSQHAYGRAIDVNPLENPWVDGNDVSPPAGRAFANRNLKKKGMIHAGDAVVGAFAAVGWGWGGSWPGPRDYQHFSANGH